MKIWVLWVMTLFFSTPLKQLDINTLCGSTDMKTVTNTCAEMIYTLTGVPEGPCGPGIGIASAPLAYVI